MKKALRLGKSSIDFAENWASIDFRWFTDNDNLHIVDNTSHHEEICKYVVSNGTLHLDSHVYYQTAEDAKENI